MPFRVWYSKDTAIQIGLASEIPLHPCVGSLKSKWLKNAGGPSGCPKLPPTFGLYLVKYLCLTNVLNSRFEAYIHGVCIQDSRPNESIEFGAFISIESIARKTRVTVLWIISMAIGLARLTIPSNSIEVLFPVRCVLENFRLAVVQWCIITSLFEWYAYILWWFSTHRGSRTARLLMLYYERS